MRHSKKWPRTGFTLLEILIALAVLAIALVTLLGLKNRDLEMARISRDVTVATALARMKISEVALGNFPVLGETEGDFGKEYADFQWRLVVSPTPFEAVREIQARVTREHNEPEGVELTQYVFEKQ